MLWLYYALVFIQSHRNCFDINTFYLLKGFKRLLTRLSDVDVGIKVWEGQQKKYLEVALDEQRFWKKSAWDLIPLIWICKAIFKPMPIYVAVVWGQKNRNEDGWGGARESKRTAAERSNTNRLDIGQNSISV